MYKFDYSKEFDCQEEFYKNTELAKQAGDYLSDIISKAKQENIEINEKIKNKGPDLEYLLGIRYGNWRKIRVFKSMLNEIIEVKHTGIKPYKLIEANSKGFRFCLDDIYDTVNNILNQMSDFNLEEYYNYLERLGD